MYKTSSHHYIHHHFVLALIINNMVSLKFVMAVATLVASAVHADKSAVDLLQDMYNGCVRDFSVSCVKPKALSWISDVVDRPVIRVTDDLVIIKKDNLEYQEQRGLSEDIFDKFEDFLQTHELIAKAPAILKADGPLGSLVPRSFQPEDVQVPLAATGRSSKLVKKVIVPFLLGLKFKTAVLVPLALALIALKTWKALTLGLLSMVLTGALLIFKFTKPKVVNYEVIHYPQHVDHHIEHAPVAWEHPGYGRELTAQEMAYSGHLDN